MRLPLTEHITLALLACATVTASASPLVASSIDEVHQAIRNLAETMQEYDGSLRGSASVVQIAYETRRSVNQLSDNIDNMRPYDIDDSLAVWNASAQMSPRLADGLNMGVTKMPLLFSAGYKDWTQKFAQSMFDQDMALANAIRDRMHDDHRDAYSESIVQVEDAYAAVLRAAS